jgi:hypothetical protein
MHFGHNIGPTHQLTLDVQLWECGPFAVNFNLLFKHCFFQYIDVLIFKYSCISLELP